MVAAERVVQVEADNITVGQAEVFAHCDWSQGEQQAKRAGADRFTVHTLTCVRQHNTTDMSMSPCDGEDGTAVCTRAAQSSLTAPWKEFTEPGVFHPNQLVLYG